MEGVVIPFSKLFGGYFRGKRILVTGHTGFKGAWLSLWLRELGADVTGYSLEPPSHPSLFEQCDLSSKMRSLRGDVRDLKALQDCLAAVRPQIVFHLAAQAYVRESYRGPVETFSTNTMGTAHVLEAVRLAGKGIRVCQIVTSDKCYQNKGRGYTYTEDDPPGGADPYSASKGAAELVVGAYRNSFFPAQKIAGGATSVSTVRSGNVIGGGDWGAERLVPDCIRALRKQKSIVVRNPLFVRPWQYALDALSGHLCLARAQATGEPLYASAWNFGPLPGQEVTVQDLATMVVGHWGSGKWIKSRTDESSAGKKFHEAVFLKLDCSKSMTHLPWRPVYRIAEAIQKTVQWYRRAHDAKNFDAYVACVDQIQGYVQTARERKCAWALSR